jgi:deoxyribodipyrimidine photolyase-related protein
MISRNFWGHQRKLKSCWYDATTGLPPLDDAIQGCNEFGYTHHINRLMILSNIMNMSGIHPDEIYKWFMEMFIDSSDWVMVPNVYGMGTYADGGVFSTKPYICGSSYILRMSNFKKGEWCDAVDGLYWQFIENNRSFFSKNPRLSLMTRSLDKIAPDRKKLIYTAAENFIKQTTYE